MTSRTKEYFNFERRNMIKKQPTHIVKRKQKLNDESVEKDILKFINKLPQHLLPLIFSFIQSNVIDKIRLCKYMLIYENIENQVKTILNAIPDTILYTFIEKSNFTNYNNLFYIHMETFTLYEYCANECNKWKTNIFGQQRWIFQHVVERIVIKSFNKARQHLDSKDVKKAIHLYNTILHVNKKFAIQPTHMHTHPQVNTA